MASLESFKKDAKKAYAESEARDIAAAEKMYDAQKQTVEDNYNTQIADTEVSYEDAFKSNDVQRQLNERYLERKASELGLTDSGMSRTQQTAVQLSYANQRGSLNAQKQKAIDTLAQTMRAKMTEIETNRISAVETIRSDYDDKATTQAVSMWESWQDSQAKIRAAQIQAAAKATEAGKENRKAEWDTLVAAFDAGAVKDPNVAAKMIHEFGTKYGMSNAEMAILQTKAKLEDGEYQVYIKNVTDGNEGTIYTPAQDYWRLHKDGQTTGRVNWDFATNGALRYTFKITKATNNGGGKVDYNDEVSIYYPDGTLLAENVPLKNLPTTKYKDVNAGNEELSVQQSVTNRTAKKKKGDSFYFTVDLAGLKLPTTE